MVRSRRRSPATQTAAHAASRAHPPARSNGLLALQHAAGNRAVASLLAPLSVQRTLVTDDLAGAVDFSTASASAFGRSSFGAVVTAAELYDTSSATDLGKRHRLLERVEAAALQWLRSHAGAKAARDAKRRTAVDALLDRVAAERARVSKQEAQDVYMSDMTRGKDPSDPRAKFAMEALSPLAKNAATRKLGPGEEKFAKAAGLTPAEVAAIKTFTSPDYEYINPTTAANASWLGGQQSKWAKGSTKPGMDQLYKNWSKVGQKPMVEEGTLHTGVAMGGLEKIEKYQGRAFRGERLTLSEFGAKYGKKVIPTTNLSSATKDLGVALRFALGLGAPQIDAKKNVAVIAVLEDTGARDITAISEVQGEKEVVLLPGAGYEFTVESFDSMSLPQAAQFASAEGGGDLLMMLQQAKSETQPAPKSVIVVRLRGKHPAQA